jgi:hypothetical protein
VPGDIRERSRIERFNRVGLVQIRRAMMEMASGRFVLWLNDDVLASPGLLEAHLRTHLGRSCPCVVAGRAIWKPVDEPNLFDRVVQETDLVFFRQPNEPAVTDYRNCFGLNLSFPRELALGVGSVAEVDEHYGYEDIEIAWRMSQAGAECHYAPDAEVIHDHRYTPSDVHRREYLLGRAAVAFAHRNPEFAQQLFRMDLRETSALDEFGVMVLSQWRDAVRIESSFLALDSFGPTAMESEMLQYLTEHWVLLKRHLWRWGVLDAARGIAPRWSPLRETSPDAVLSPALNPV